MYISRTYANIGEYAKAIQYAEQAVKDVPTDPYLRGNWGVMLYHNLQWPESAVQLSLAVNGGVAEEGQAIQPLALTSDIRITEYFFTYALVLARLGRCTESLPVVQLIEGTVPGNDLAVYNAQEAIRICEQTIRTPSPTPPPPSATSTP